MAERLSPCTAPGVFSVSCLGRDILVPRPVKFLLFFFPPNQSKSGKKKKKNIQKIPSTQIHKPQDLTLSPAPRMESVRLPFLVPHHQVAAVLTHGAGGRDMLDF